MLYYRDSSQKYATEYVHAWRLNDDGSVDFRDSAEDNWTPAAVLTTEQLLEDALYAGNIEQCDNPYDFSPVQQRALTPLDPDLQERALRFLNKEYDCRNDS